MKKYFWEVGALPDDNSNYECISLTVSLSNTFTLMFFIRWWPRATWFVSTFISLSFIFCFQISRVAWISCFHWNYNLLSKTYLLFQVPQLLKLQFNTTRLLSTIINLLNHKYWDCMCDESFWIGWEKKISGYGRCLGKKMENH